MSQGNTVKLNLLRERDLQKALQLSQEEEASRTRAIEEANGRSLFDEQNQQLVVFTI